MIKLIPEKIVWINEDRTMAHTLFSKNELGTLTKVTLDDVWTNYFKCDNEYHLFNPKLVAEGLKRIKGRRECFLLEDSNNILAIFSRKSEGCILIAPIIENDRRVVESRIYERHTSVFIPRRFLKN